MAHNRAHANGVILWKGVFLPSKCLLESPFLEPLLRTFLEPFLCVQPTARHLLRTLLRTFSKVVSRTLLRTLLRRLSHDPLGVRPIQELTMFAEP